MGVRSWNVGNFIVGTNSREVVIKFFGLHVHKYISIEMTSGVVLRAFLFSALSIVRQVLVPFLRVFQTEYGKTFSLHDL